MTNYQLGIFNEEANVFNVSEFKVTSSDIPSIKKAIKKAIKTEDEGIEVVVSFGKDVLDKISPAHLPEKLNSFKTLEGKNGYSMPSTQADIYFRIVGVDTSAVLDQTLKIQESLTDVAEVVLSENGFVYKDHRDLTGFVDGSANPKEEKKYAAALIPAGEKGEGGSFVFHQKWVHDLQKFNELPVSVQEKIIGRTKVDSIELEGDDMPVDSHVSRTDAKHDGVAMKIWRRSFPFGSAKERGLMFISYTCDPFRVDIQLDRMLGNTEDGHSDQIMNYSTAVTGAYSFAPSTNDLAEILD
ncbi:Dyp-type peroxidase [Flammeovirga sp. MY04]|uniref:Dyp-type peroxidase n=1 Tax=Flammeovirga sp. MY04 TaxID=1191459 RepID=UPI00080633FA|nr:Dyp-type peroxidase [Flammeovirga sp. MY04]ANQ47954.1 Dyp-type peroxidase [Flammeovirga sp. MY04]